MNKNIISNLYKNDKTRQKTETFIIKLLRNYAKSDKIKQVLETHNKKSDKIIFRELAKIVTKTDNLYSSDNNVKRALSKWQFIRPNIPKKLKIGSILDFGGNVGDAAYALGGKLGLTKYGKKNIYSVDVNDWSGEKWEPRSDITFIHTNNIHEEKYMSDGEIDMIMTFHVLHHIEPSDVKKIITTFDRILSQKGFIVLYEHDCNSSLMKDLIDLEHVIFDVVISQKLSYDQFIKSYYAKYESKEKWDKLFSRYFKKYKTIELKNKDNSFYHFYTRK